MLFLYNHILNMILEALCCFRFCCWDALFFKIFSAIRKTLPEFIKLNLIRERKNFPKIQNITHLIYKTIYFKSNMEFLGKTQILEIKLSSQCKPLSFKIDVT